MEIHFTVASTAGEQVDILLRAPGDAQVGSLLTVLSNFIEQGSHVDGEWKVNGAPLDQDLSLVASGWRDGDILTPPNSESSSGRGGPAHLESDSFDIRIISGPHSGSQYSLAPGTWTIGRQAGCDVVLQDEEVSRRHARLALALDGMTIEDLGSANGTYINDRPISGATPLQSGATVEIGQSFLVITPPAGANAMPSISAGSTDVDITPSSDGGLAFNRPPRLLGAAPSVVVTIPEQPKEGNRASLSIAGMVAPLAIGVVMAVVLKQVTYLAFTAASPIIGGATYLTQRRQGKKSHRAATKEYREATARAKGDLASALQREAQERLNDAPGPNDVLAIAAGPRHRLWERRPSDPDYLHLRVGCANQSARIRLFGATEELVIPDAPTVIDLRSVGVLGVASSRGMAQGLVKWLVAQLVVLHSPRNVSVEILTSSDQGGAWNWTRWLPHLRSDNRSSFVQIGNDVETCSKRILELSKIVETRTKASASPGRIGSSTHEGDIVVILDGARELRLLPGATQVLREGPAVGVRAICLDDAERLLPEECRAVIAMDMVSVLGGTPIPGMTPLPGSQRDGSGGSSDSGVVLRLRSSDGAVVEAIKPDRVTSQWSEQVARALAPIRDVSREEAASSLPTSLRLLDLMGLEPPDPDVILSRWEDAGRTTSAVIGESIEGIFHLDLSRDGPHGLVAGTTGSGKSELLQTIIAALATANRPSAMGFVLVDYKGGSAFKDCARLPHTLGMVTDLDSHLTERALASLSAELRRRKFVLDEAGCKDVDDYFRRIDSGLITTDASIGRLVIVIDEFASLVEELPEFVGGLVGIARQGRSLGVHLLLATQRPGGVVSPEIRANTNLRIALRVTDPSESSDVIDTPDAARIAESVPGRGFARLGHDRLVAFQAGRVGGLRATGPRSSERTEIAAVPWLGLGRPAKWDSYRLDQSPELSNTAFDQGEGEHTDLSILVDVIGRAAERLPPTVSLSPWLEPLPEVVLVEQLPGVSRSSERQVAALRYGLEDLPDQQRQASVSLDLEHGGHLLAAGSARSGRTTLLRTIAGSLAYETSPADVHLYAIDCGNGGLVPLTDLPHCGAVVTRSEIERADRLLGRLAAEVSRRQQLLSVGGFANIVEQRLAVEPKDRLPYVVLMIDRWEGFTAAFEDVDGGRLIGQVQGLLREASAAGLRAVITGDRTALTGRLSTFVEDRIVLRFNDRGDYGMAGLNPRKLPDVILPGRAFRADTASEMQIALLDLDHSGPGQSAALTSAVAYAWQQSTQIPAGALPDPVATLPTRVGLSDIAVSSDGAGALAALIGIGGDLGLPVRIDLGRDGPSFIIAGSARTGRSTALTVMTRSLLAGGSKVILVAPRPSPIRELEGLPGVVAVLVGQSIDPQALLLACETEGPMVVLVDDAELIGDGSLNDALAQVVKSARDKGFAVVAAGTGEDMKSGFRGFLAEARKSKTGLILSPQSPMDGDVIGARLPRTSTLGGPPGRGVLVIGNQSLMVQVPTLD